MLLPQLSISAFVVCFLDFALFFNLSKKKGGEEQIKECQCVGEYVTDSRRGRMEIFAEF